MSLNNNIRAVVNDAPSILKRLYAARVSLDSLKKTFPEKLFSAAAKKFPAQADLGKLPNSDALNSADKIKEFELVATGIDSFAKWRESARGALNGLGKTFQTLSLEYYYDLFVAFMDLAAAYARASLLFASMPQSEKRGATMIHCALCAKTSPDKGKCTDAAKKLLEGGELTFCEGLTECQPLLKSALESLPYLSDVEMLRADGVIDFTGAGNFDAPAQSTKVFNACLANRVPMWAGFGVFLVPKVLDGEPPKTVAALLQQHAIFPLYGELYIDIYDELERQAKELKAGKSPNAIGSKKVLHDLASTARTGAVAAHLRRLLYVKQELGVVYHYCKSTPALCAPKLLNILAGLSFAQSEARCAMYTITALRADGKNADAGRELEELLPEVMYYATGLEKLLVASKDAVRAYYLAYLARADRDALQEDGVFGASIQQITHGDIGSLLANVSSSLDAALKEECRDTATALGRVLATEFGLARAGHKVPFSKFLRVLHLHLTVAESVEGLLAPFGMEWAWYLREQLARTFRRHVDSRTSQQHCANARSAIEPLYVSAYYAVMSHADRLLDGAAFPDEGRTLCEETKKALRGFSDEVVDKIFLCAHDLLAQYEEYDRQVSPERVVLRVQQRRQMVDKNFEMPMLPGTESMPDHWDSEPSVKVRTAFVTLDRLCWAVREAEVIQIGEYVCDLPALVRTRFADALDKRLGELFKPCDDLAQYVRPSDALRRVRVMHFALTNIESALPLDLDALWRQALLKHFSPQAFADLSTFSCAVDPCTVAEKTALGGVLRFYKRVLEEKLVAGEAVFSPKRCAFVSRTAGTFKAELYTDFNDLRDLCTLVGPVGVKALDAMVLVRVCDAVEKIGGILARSRDELAQLARERGGDAAAGDARHEPKELGEFVRHAIDAGTCLAFRGLLKTAQRYAAETCAPMLFDALANVHDEYLPNVYQLPELARMDFLALSLGIESPVTLQDVKTALRERALSGAAASSAVWDGFPRMLAAAFDSPTFRASQYLPALEGFQTNVHVLYFCLTELLCSIAVVVRGREEAAEADLSEAQPPSAVAAQRTFVSTASSLIYRIYQQAITAADAKGKKEIFADLYSMFVFMDDFFTHGTFLTRTDLETHLPYALLREAFRKELSTQTNLNAKQSGKQGGK